MKILTILPILLMSIFLFSGCSDNNLFLQSIKSTAPKNETENLGSSFAPVNVNYIDLYGNVLTTREDMPLYTYSKDSNGISNCNDDCEIVWPPFLVDYEEDVSGKYKVLKRTDGSLQATYNGMPLYTYTPDTANNVTGDGKENAWTVIVVE